jgi:glutathione synthase/RimK-type ligase-like ATP-grasp enzyme
MKFALITCESLRNYNSNVVNEDDLIINFLKIKRVDIDVLIWTDSHIEWEKYDYLIIKSPWDYFDRYVEFLQWLNKLESLGVKVLNPVSILKWNSDKIYLKDLEEGGVKIIPTVWLGKGERLNVDACMKQLSSEIMVFKPRISGGAKNTFIIDKYSSSEKILACNYLLESESYMAQPFMEEIQTEGEWSFVFFNGKFSHALLKTPCQNDFRVQHYHGGKITSMEAPKHLLNQAQDVVDKFAKNCLYARVDGVVKNGDLLLMELELIEPMLFLFTNDDSFENYYSALKEITGMMKDQVKI